LQLWAATNRGGDPQKAAATLRRGVEAAYREALAGARPAWVPSWGGPENLMNLAFLYSRTTLSNRAAAIAYAEGAVTAVPEWPCARAILLPQIEAMPDAPAPAPPAK